MFKRVIKIILILLAVFLLILGIIWLIGRHTAEKNGTTPLSFKQFIGLSSKTTATGTGSNASGSESSTFTGNGTGTNGNGTGGNASTNGNGTGGASDVTNVSDFTDGGLSPSGVSNTGFGSNTNDTNSNGVTSDNGFGNGSSDTTAGSTAPACSTADTTITFTAVQLAQLNALQNRFYTLAQTLHTDADVATELANHDAFALKAQQVTELYNYCEAQIAQAPFTTTPQLQIHVPTPFWRPWNSTTDPSNPDNWTPTGVSPDPSGSLSFLYYSNPADVAYLTQTHDDDTDPSDPAKNNYDTSGFKGPYGSLNFGNLGVVSVDGSTLKPPAILLQPVVERILRINLW